MKTCTLLVILTLCLISASAQQSSNNNDSVVKMVKAGMSDDIVISTIDSQPAHFALDSTDLIALKQAGVSDKVMAAMIAKNNPAATTAAGSTSGSLTSAIPLEW